MTMMQLTVADVEFIARLVATKRQEDQEDVVACCAMSAIVPPRGRALRDSTTTWPSKRLGGLALNEKLPTVEAKVNFPPAPSVQDT